MTIVRPSHTTLMIDGLSYSDWEDSADRLRQLATGKGRITMRHLARAEELLSSLDDELEAIDSVLPTLTGFDAVRVGCVRDLLVAFRISVGETQRLLRARPARKTPKRQATAA